MFYEEGNAQHAFETQTHTCCWVALKICFRRKLQKAPLSIFPDNETLSAFIPPNTELMVIWFSRSIYFPRPFFVAGFLQSLAAKQRSKMCSKKAPPPPPLRPPCDWSDTDASKNRLDSPLGRSFVEKSRDTAALQTPPPNCLGLIRSACHGCFFTIPTF